MNKRSLSDLLVKHEIDVTR